MMSLRGRPLLFLFSVLTSHLIAAEPVFYAEGPPVGRRVAITFDDGPHPVYTPKVLDLLKKHGAKATFFVVGEMVRKYPEVLRRIHSAGHEIGNHTETHRNFFRVKDAEAARKGLEEEVRRSEARIARLTGRTTRFLRMPHGFRKPWVEEFARENRYVLVNWSFGCDWKKMTAEKMAGEYLRHLKPGAILLFHDGGGNRSRTLRALEEILPEIRARGYAAVGVGDLLGLSPERADGKRLK